MRTAGLVHSMGVPTVGIGPVLTTGKVLFVSSVHPNRSATGPGTIDAPFSTIDAAIGYCDASKGDIILVAPGHTETVSAAAGINVDVAGISIIGLGQGALRPTITLSAVASTVAIGAASCTLRNLLFLVSEDATIVLDVNAADTTIEDCEFRNSASKEAVTWIDINGGAANACDRTTIRRCKFRCPAVGSDRAIELGEVADSVTIEDCDIFGDFGDACIHNITGKVLTRLSIRRCSLTNTQSGDHAIELVSACTGVIEWCTANSTLSAVGTRTGIDPGACFVNECYGSDGVGDVSGVNNPAYDA